MQTKNLFDICNPKQWKTLSTKDLIESGYPVYGAGGVIGYWTDYNHDKETLIIGCRGSCGNLMITERQSYINGNAMALDDLNTSLVDIKYLYYYLLYRGLDDTVTGGVQKQITRTSLKNVFIPIPPLETQKNIVDVLDKAQGLIDARKEQIKLMDELIQSVFYEMFGDPVTNPKGWEKYRLEKFISFLTSGSRGWSQYFRNKGEMFLTIKNVKNNEITLDNIQYVCAPNTKEAERTKVQEGDLLISITADLGRTGVVNSEIAQYGAYINQHLSLVRLNDEYVRPMYVSYFLESKGGKIQFDAKNQNGVKAGLNFNAIKSLELLVPPMRLQDEFVRNVTAINQSKSDMQKNLDEIYNICNALMQEAFKGDLFGGE